jgi:hypothetical protein
MVEEQTDTLDKHTQKVFLLEAHIIQKLQQDLELNLAQPHLLVDIMEEILAEITQAEVAEALQQLVEMDLEDLLAAEEQDMCQT